MSFIYLDIDGVLATNATYRAAYKRGGNPRSTKFLVSLLDPKKVELLNQIVAETGAKIILSSTWRHITSVEGHTTFDILKMAGVRAEFEGATGPDYANRGLELKEDILARGLCPNSYVILDDDVCAADHLKGIGHKGNRWLQTSDAMGMSQKHVTKAVQLLRME